MKMIAVIEDDQPIGNLLEESLTREGYGILRAYSGTEALYLPEKHRPDLILLDLMLPGLYGEELLARITVQLRRTQARRLAPVLKAEELRLDTGSHELTLCNIPGTPDQNRICDIKAPAAAARTGNRPLRTAGVYQSGYPRLLRRLPEAAYQQSAKKLLDIDGHDYIEAVWGIGFRLVLSNGS